MLNRFKFLLKACAGIAGCVAMIGSAQAAPVQLTANSTVKGDTSWQDIKGTSYTFNDANHDGKLNVGETATFTVDMHKTYWGIHDFDALKFWIDSPSGTNLSTNQGVWDFDPTNKNAKENTWYQNSYGTWVYANDTSRPWTGGDKLFSFDYTFNTAGVFDLVASVMCSADLASLTYGNNDAAHQKALKNANWGAWNENFHSLPGWKQGETEKYKLTVVQSPVPEPETYGMMLVGLGLMGFTVRRRKDFPA
jgi:hypothetical protein